MLSDDAAPPKLSELLELPNIRDRQLKANGGYPKPAPIGIIGPPPCLIVSSAFRFLCRLVIRISPESVQRSSRSTIIVILLLPIIIIIVPVARKTSFIVYVWLRRPGIEL